jgi:transcriptional regulator with GAF, ATPase, and Fis domain
LAVTSSLDLKTVLKFLLEKIDLLLPQSITTVRLLNHETGELERVACRNVNEKDEEVWKALKWKTGTSLARVVLETKQPLIVPNVHLDPRTRNPEILQSYGLVSYLGVPLIVRGETLGLIAFYTKGEHQFSDEESEFLSTLAGQAAIAIHNSQLYERAKKQAIALERSHGRTKILHEINVAITSSLELKAILDLLLARIESLLPYHVTTVRLLNKQTGILEPVASRNIDVSEWKARKWTRGLGLSNAVLETRAPVVVATLAWTRGPDTQSES